MAKHIGLASGAVSRRQVCLSLLGGLGLSAVSPPLVARASTDTLKIVSIGGSITEIVVALGRGGGLVGVDTTSQFPQTVLPLPKVGYMRTLSPEGVLSLGPEIIVASDRSGPEPVVQQLQATGVLRLIPDIPTINGVQQKILAVGDAIGRKAEADLLSEHVAADFKAITQQTMPIADRPRVAFLHNIGRSSPLAGGRNTPADAMIFLAGGTNAFDEFDDYKPVSAEAVINAAPDIFIMTPGTIEGFGGLDSVLNLPHVAGTPAGENKGISEIDGLFTLGFGPRVAHAIHDLAMRFHPDRKFTPLPMRSWV